jgi:hypothetical protein
MSRLKTLAGKVLWRIFPRRGPPMLVCGCPADKQGLPLGKTFRDILIMPGQSNPSNINLIDGGPVWPDFSKQIWVRHRRKNRPVDKMVDTLQKPTEYLVDACVWGGMVHFHFGHLCAEFLTRIPWSLARWPHATFLFIVKETEDISQVPDCFWNILQQLGLPKEQVKFIQKPTKVSKLHVMPQAEQVRFKTRAPESYIRLLQANTQSVLNKAIPSDCLYVSRVGMLEKRAGANAAERYLVDLLSLLNVSTLDPSQTQLNEQLTRYAGARTLIFAEGSAVHGRQLLGRIDQNCIILNRRPLNRKTGRMLASRVQNLTFVEATAKTAAFWAKRGVFVEHRAMSFYDVPVLFQAFAAVGIDLASHWDMAVYEKIKRQDAVIWLKNLASDAAVIDMPSSYPQIADIFGQEGLSDLLAEFIQVSTVKDAFQKRVAS